MIFNIMATYAKKMLVFFDGSLNTASFGSLSGKYSITDSKLKVFGGSNDVACSKYVDVTAYNKLTVVVPENDHVKCAVRIKDSSGKQVAATTITASSTGTFELDLGSVTGKCTLVLGASSNATNDYILFSSIIFRP